MFEFDEVSKKELKELRRKIRTLENQVAHWKSLYELEVKKRPQKTTYITDEQYFDKYYIRTKELLKIMTLTENIEYWQMLVYDLMEMYGVEEKKWNTMLYMMKMIDH